MNDIESRLDAAAAARNAGRHEDALRIVQDVYAVLEGPEPPQGASLFGTMFLWEQLCEEHAPARAALACARDAQLQRVLSGGDELAVDALQAEGIFLRRPRFSLLVQMNEILGDPASTHAAFVALERTRPAWARRHAWRALPAIVAVGDFALADRCRGDPLLMLGVVNENARTLPLFPQEGAPRLAADLTTLARDVALGIAVLRGLGRATEADALRQALVDGLEADALRSLALRELDAPGTIQEAILDHEIAKERQRRA